MLYVDLETKYKWAALTWGADFDKDKNRIHQLVGIACQFDTVLICEPITQVDIDARYVLENHERSPPGNTERQSMYRCTECFETDVGKRVLNKLDTQKHDS